LRATFGRFGNINRVKILEHKNCAFVNFDDVDSAVRARAELNNSMLGGVQIRVRLF
jgi:protein JSN1